MEDLEGFVEHIIYRNRENGYLVFRLSAEDDDWTCTGSASLIEEGMYVLLKGDFVDHPSYGPQFSFVSYETKKPNDVLSIEKYLSSGAVKGIGAKLASAIVREFGEDTFRIMEEEPERLVKIRGISEKKARDIAVQMETKQDLRNAVIFLQQYGISQQMAVRIFEYYGDRVYGILKENPYRLAEDIDGVGFRMADQIAAKAGILVDSDFRIHSGILYLLMQASREGHLYLPLSELNRRADELLGFAVPEFLTHVRNLMMERKVVLNRTDPFSDDPAVYPAVYYYMERQTAELLAALDMTFEEDGEPWEERLAKAEKGLSVTLDPLQREAVLKAARHGVFIMTGGPGTGKTTTVRAMIALFESAGMEILLAAPTGRAARRMTEATGREAKTIHRLLEVNAGAMERGPEHSYFYRNEDEPLEGDVIIIDETSMVDLFLMRSLLLAVTPGTRLIFAGDVDQLPSVGPGAVLSDMIGSGCFCTVRLDRIFRQAAESDIVMNAHRINRGEHITVDNKSRDFFLLPRKDPETILKHMILLIREKLPPYVGATPYDIQVLTPMRKGVLGAENLNTVLQQHLNPPSKDKEEKISGSAVFREGDKVMQIRNNYQLKWQIRGLFGIPVDEGLGVFNGDTGRITSIDPFSEEVTVLFDEEREVVYTFGGLDDLELAYAVTVHKSQGSEYPAVILPLLGGTPLLFNRNLLYTAVTRAKRCVTILGDERVMTGMIDNDWEQKRYTGLKQFIREAEESRP